ncbi:flavodoxin family protein [Tepidibacter hydrothermalis]|uniref:Flavodoxin family protein n=1 Tax=Tepidibacter hydrothermalis TaxID=3036126 RepID=A0ABY8EBB9_9FIRM|nr:flavodoxin family protein [Tepidibacter hydrothermalis]WFD09190.1 flavodoxin family protein [Tepidibacter hydrothermalis]
MKFLIINASPRKGKNCYIISDYVADILYDNDIEYEMINIWDMDIEYCNACGYCDKTGVCHKTDDMSHMYKKFDESDGTILISPVYFDGVPAKLKSLIDRTQSFFASKYILKRPSIDRNKKRLGMFIHVGGSKPYKTQFMGGQITVDFLFKSINTKLIHNYYISNTDDVDLKNNDLYKEDIKKLIIDLKNKG